jgi:uncharacterized radical SAM superfamily Fe-S cluster-containing enzyme
MSSGVQTTRSMFCACCSRVIKPLAVMYWSEGFGWICKTCLEHPQKGRTDL